MYHVLIVNPDSQVAVQFLGEDEQRQEGGRAAEGHVSQKGSKLARFREETRSWYVLVLYATYDFNLKFECRERFLL